MQSRLGLLHGLSRDLHGHDGTAEQDEVWDDRVMVDAAGRRRGRERGSPVIGVVGLPLVAHPDLPGIGQPEDQDPGDSPEVIRYVQGRDVPFRGGRGVRVTAITLGTGTGDRHEKLLG